jgi:hypothetical protein
MTCKERACTALAYCREMCLRHYREALRAGERVYSPRVIGNIAERLWSKVTGGDYTECWIWTGSVNERGYGRLSIDGKPRRVHRIAYELMVGEIPEGLELDHLCNRRACVNPWHLEPVTHAVNIARKTERVS